MKRISSSRSWIFLGVSALLCAATLVASRRFPPAPAEPASVELRARLEALKTFDKGRLEKARRGRALVGAMALSTARASEIQGQLAHAWEVTTLPPQTVGDVAVTAIVLRRSGAEWHRLIADLREMQKVAGLSVSAVSVSARGSVLSVELTAKIVAHSQPANDKASGLPDVVRPSQIR